MPYPNLGGDPVDLDALNDYLLSDRSPPECMDVSQLDGFLAGLVIGPETITPHEFLPVIWGGDEPSFVDAHEANMVMGTILGRYNEIIDGLDETPASYAPVFWQDRAGNSIFEDWAVGFMQAVGMRQNVWEAVLADDEYAMLLIPIGVIAAVAEPETGMIDVNFPESFVDELFDKADDLVPACVIGLRAYWREHAAEPNQGSVSPSRLRH